MVDRITLAEQHMKSSKDINIQCATKIKKMILIHGSAFIICMNSLQRLAELTKADKHKYVVFIVK